MKKWLLVLLCTLVILIVSIYLLIPRTIAVVRSQRVNANQEAVLRFLSLEDNWKKIWPGNTEKTTQGTNFYYYDDYHFFVNKLLYNSIELTIEKNKDTVQSVLYFLPLQLESFTLQWATAVPSGNDPFTKMQRYFFARKTEKIFQTILSRLADSFGKTATIYDLDIRKEKVQFDHFLSTKTSFDHYPGTAEIYDIIGNVKEYVSKTGGKETANPILNITTKDSAFFDVQVAIPVDKVLPDNGTYSSKWMMKDGNILVADVKGDTHEINKGFNRLTQYIIDHQRTIIAIPFQMLITDRTKEPNPSKWMTRLYYPVV